MKWDSDIINYPTFHDLLIGGRSETSLAALCHRAVRKFLTLLSLAVYLPRRGLSPDLRRIGNSKLDQSNSHPPALSRVLRRE